MTTNAARVIGDDTNHHRSSLTNTLKAIPGAGKLKIGIILVKEGIITEDQRNEAVDYQEGKSALGQESPLKLSTILLKMNHIGPNTIPGILSRKYNYLGAKSSDIDKNVIKKFDADMMKKEMAIPLFIDEGILYVALIEPTDSDSIVKIQNAVEMSISTRVISEPDLIKAYEEHYGLTEDELNDFKKPLHVTESVSKDDLPVTPIEDFGSIISAASNDIQISSEEPEEVKDELNANAAPIIKLVDGILTDAILNGVSDIHIEPYEKVLQVRCRKDGALFKAMNLPITIKNAITSRVKIISSLKIEEKRIPQDGRAKITLGKKTVDLRVATLPVMFGEKIVMRVLDQSNLQVDMTQLGFDDKTFKALKRSIERPFGLILVTGPTGSGKTTTLYSGLSRLNREDINIMTAEDPVEFNIKGINQVNVNNAVGLTYAAALKSFLRQDPDVIMIGEIRDIETAEIAIKAAMTGHLVLSTLHTNDCPSTINRMIDMGVAPYLIASSLTMVLSQRLVRRLCSCKKISKPPDLLLKKIGFEEEEIASGIQTYSPVGCEKCNGTGYKGRVGLYELMEAKEDIVNGIAGGISESKLRKIAVRNGMNTLRRSGLNKIVEGVTSMEEVVKATVLHQDELPEYLANPDVEIYEDGETIIHEGNNDRDFFSLVRGQLNVFKAHHKVASIKEPGAFFGELAAISEQTRTATVKSVGRSTVKRFPGDKLLEIITDYPETAKPLVRNLAKRLSETVSTLGNIASKHKQLIAQVSGGKK